MNNTKNLIMGIGILISIGMIGIGMAMDSDMNKINTNINNLNNDVNKINIDINNLNNDVNKINTDINNLNINTNNLNINMNNLKLFLLRDQIDKLQPIDEIIDDNDEIVFDGFTCYDFSRMLQRNAKKENITMGVLYIRDRYKFSNSMEFHVVNYVYINNIIYVIEPQTDEIMKIEKIKTRYNSSYITVIDINDNFYPRTVRYNSNGKPYNFPLEVDYNLSGE